MKRKKSPKSKKSSGVKKTPVPKPKAKKIDWRKYNQALKDRGRITLWIETETVEGWVDEPKIRSRGGQRVYSDVAIQSTVKNAV